MSDGEEKKKTDVSFAKNLEAIAVIEEPDSEDEKPEENQKEKELKPKENQVIAAKENQEDDSEDFDRKPWDLCKYCRSLVGPVVNPPPLSIEDHNKSEESRKAISYAQKLKTILQMSSLRRSHVIPSDRGFPASITDVTGVEDNILLVKWCIHDQYNIGGFEIYCDSALVRKIDHPKRTMAIVRGISNDDHHRIQLKVRPKFEELLDKADLIDDMDDADEKCSCHNGRVLVEKIHEMRESYRQWTTSLYIYSPQNAI